MRARAVYPGPGRAQSRVSAKSGRQVSEKGARLHVVPRPGAALCSRRPPASVSPAETRHPVAGEFTQVDEQGPAACRGALLTVDKYPGEGGHFDSLTSTPYPEITAFPSPESVTNCRQITTPRYSHSREALHYSTDTARPWPRPAGRPHPRPCPARRPGAVRDPRGDPRQLVGEPFELGARRLRRGRLHSSHLPRPPGRTARQTPARASGEGPGSRSHRPPGGRQRPPVAGEALRGHRPRTGPRRGPDVRPLTRPVLRPPGLRHVLRLGRGGAARLRPGGSRLGRPSGPWPRSAERADGRMAWATTDNDG